MALWAGAPSAPPRVDIAISSGMLNVGAATRAIYALLS
jgi:hypothetical protein